MIALTWVALWLANYGVCLFCMHQVNGYPWGLLAASCALFSLLGTLAHWRLQKRNAEVKVFRKKWPEEGLPSNDYYINKSVKRFALGCVFMGSIVFVAPIKYMKIIELVVLAIACIVWGIMDKLTKEESRSMEKAIAEYEKQRLLDKKG